MKLTFLLSVENFKSIMFININIPYFKQDAAIVETFLSCSSRINYY
jgi:hypothetical protein